MVRAILDLNVELLENKFVIGYREDDRFLCVSLVNNLGISSLVT